MSSIFVSYNRQSEAIIKTLVDDIQTLGHTVWFDQELKGGQAWWDQILATVRNCDVFIFVLHPTALSSAACKLEYGYASALGKPILPVLVAEGISTNLLPPALSQIHFVDYRKQDRDAALRLARAIAIVPPSKPLPNPLPTPPEVPISYLGRLADQIDTEPALSYEQQSALVVDLRKSLRDPEIADDAYALLARLRKRRDLFAFVADEVDELLESISNASEDPESVPQQPEDAFSGSPTDSGKKPTERLSTFRLSIPQEPTKVKHQATLRDRKIARLVIPQTLLFVLFYLHHSAQCLDLS
jgi:hypothetical protein